MDTHEIIKAVQAITPAVEAEQIGQALYLLDGIKAFERETREKLKDRMAEWIEEQGHDLVLGDRRFYLGHKRTVHCPDKMKGLEKLFAATSGDFAAVAEMLCSDPFKHGSCKTVLSEDDWADVFEVEEKVELAEGKPKKQLIEVNDGQRDSEKRSFLNQKRALEHL